MCEALGFMRCLGQVLGLLIGPWPTNGWLDGWIAALVSCLLAFNALIA